MSTEPDDLEIATYLDWVRQRGRAQHTLDTYRRNLCRAARQLPAGLCDAEPDEIQAWLAQQRAVNTRAGCSVALRQFFAWGERTGKLDPADNPMRELEPVQHQKGQPRPVTHAELATLLDGTRDPVRLWILLAAYGGLRRAEISRVRRDDITRETIRVHGKGDRERVVPTHADIWAAVTALPPDRWEGRSPGHIGDSISAAARALGLNGVTTHRFRHWAGTWWQVATGDVRVTQELLGHASVANTMIYTAVSDSRRRAAVDALPRVNGATAAAAAGTDPPR